MRGRSLGSLAHFPSLKRLSRCSLGKILMGLAISSLGLLSACSGADPDPEAAPLVRGGGTGIQLATPTATLPPTPTPSPTPSPMPTPTTYCPPDWEAYYFAYLPLEIEGGERAWVILDQFTLLKDDLSPLADGQWQKDTLALLEEEIEFIQKLFDLADVASASMQEIDALNQARAAVQLEETEELARWIEEELQPDGAAEAFRARGNHPWTVHSTFFPESGELFKDFHTALWHDFGIRAREDNVDCALVLVDGRMVRATPTP